MSSQKYAEKFVPVEVSREPAPSELVATHLRGFSNAFIAKSHVQRWHHMLLEQPHKASSELSKFHNQHDPRYCTAIRGAAAFPLALQQRLGSMRGVYFDGRELCMLTAAQASTIDPREAILSLVPGKLAVFFQEGLVWVCERS